MSERYSRVFTLNENLYTKAAPAIIKAGALLKDNETGTILAQLKLGSITNKTIKLVKVKLSCLDSVGRPLDEITHEYLDLNVSRGTDFGSKVAIRIANTATRSFSARITEIGFTDNEIWSEKNSEWEAIPKQKSINTIIAEYYAIRAYNANFGASAKYAVKEHGDLWFCTCGAINHTNEELCYNCSASLAELKAIDVDALKEAGILAEKDQIYKISCELYESGKRDSLVKAIEGFEKIKDYKDSEEFIEKCNESLKLIEENEAKAMVAKKAKKKKSILVASIISGLAIILGLLSYFVAYPLISCSVGNYAPYINLYNVTEYKIPDGTAEIKSEAFYDCNSLTHVTIPDSVTSIGSSAFYDCDGLTSVTIGNSVTSIGEWAFSSCFSLTSITIPDSVTSIGISAFKDCSSLSSVTIGNGVTSIGSEAFSRCFNLTSVYITDIASWCGISFGIYDEPLYYADNLYLNGELIRELVIPDGVTVIPSYAFSCNNITSITIPDSVTSIGSEAFEDCSALTSVTIGNGVTSIGSEAFNGCSSLTSITIPDSVTSIGDSAFRYCDRLTSITIPDSVTSIGSSAFRNCDGLKSIVYNGTKHEWYTITKGSLWITGYGYTIYCTDGTIKKL